MGSPSASRQGHGSNLAVRGGADGPPMIRCRECSEPAIVGWGPDPVRWLCLTHFQKTLIFLDEVRRRDRRRHRIRGAE